MDRNALQPLLAERTELVIGDVRDTVPEFVRSRLKAPLGFVAIDVDLYTSTRDAFTILSLTERK